MSYQVDYSLLDQPQLLGIVFFPRRDWTPPPAGASDHLVAVEENVSISCRFYPSSESSPSILFFHGNGEVACDHDWIAPLYNREGINLFVADYRGYGRSGGRPTFSSMVADAHVIFDYFHQLLRSIHYNGPLFVMGRSLGSQSAMELASSYSDQMKGLIVESGFANPGRLLRYLAPHMASSHLEEFERVILQRIRSITVPVLVIHAEDDEIVPLDQALSLYQNVGSNHKTLRTIPGAGHNDIMLIGMEQYFSAIRKFVFG